MSEAVIIGWERCSWRRNRSSSGCEGPPGRVHGAGLSYAVVGGNAVAEWVARVDDEAVRNTRDVDVLVRRADFAAVRAALEAAASLPATARRGRFHRWSARQTERRSASSLRRRKGAADRRISLPELEESATRGRVPGSGAFGLGAHEAHVLASERPRPLARYDPGGTHRCDLACAFAATACRAFAELAR